MEVRKESIGFQSRNKLANASAVGRTWLAIWLHSNSLIKNLTPLEDEVGICLLNFPLYAARRFTQN